MTLAYLVLAFAVGFVVCRYTVVRKIADRMNRQYVAKELEWSRVLSHLRTYKKFAECQADKRIPMTVHMFDVMLSGFDGDRGKK